MKIDYKRLKDSLQYNISNADKVYITAHKIPDLDAIGSAIGIYKIVESFFKDVSIVMEYDNIKIDYTATKALEDIFIGFNIIKPNEVRNITDKTLLIVTDVNNLNIVDFDLKKLAKIKNIIVVDHHKLSADTIKTENSFVDEKLSSACEAVGKLLYMFNIKITPKEIYNYILAGIVLDTKFLSNNKVTPATISIENYLLKKGADLKFVNSMFNKTFQEDRIIQNLVNYANFSSIQNAVIMNRENPRQQYIISQLASCADYVLQFVDIAIAMGYISAEEIYLSSRSKGVVHAGDLMYRFGGGGNAEAAAACIKTDDIYGLYEEVNGIFRPDYTKEFKYVLK